MKTVHTTVDVLLEHGLVSNEAVGVARLAAEVRGVPLLRELVDSGLIDRGDAARAFAEAAGLEYVELADIQVDASASGRVPVEHARRLGVVPLGWEGSRLVVATSDPSDVLMLDDLRVMTGRELRVLFAPRWEIEEKLAKIYRAEDELGTISQGLAGADVDDMDDLAVGEAGDDAPIVRYVNLLVTQAVADRASDIHVEPTETDLRIRFRIDGVLHEIMRSPRNIQSGVISRLKIMSDINIAERRIPQDGRMSLMYAGSKVDLRVATLPTVWGEKVVLRILDNSTALLNLEKLGFAPDNMSRFRGAYKKPYGMILVTGPTGSGKSTTLYATLNIVSKPEINVITVEDPVEYRLAGINQVQVNNKAGLSFAAALRSILRADPDVVLIGEIRDRETAKIAVEAALTGHLVLSTLHTNDAASAVGRLVEMGVEPFLVASALDCVVAQRLCRRLCEKCKQQYTPKPVELTDVGFPWAEGEALPDLYRAQGCSACSRTGYRGRLALHEIMTVNEEIERLTVNRAGTDAIATAAAAAGMTPLRADGWRKVAQGLTSIEEVLRVVV